MGLSGFVANIKARKIESKIILNTNNIEYDSNLLKQENEIEIDKLKQSKIKKKSNK